MNLELYNAVRQVPQEAQREIKGGRLSGKTDINPMWRIKALTEQFGPCGIGWKPVIKKTWIEKADNGEVAAFVEIELYIKVDGQWSDAIPGTGGSMFVAQENKGPYVSDECYKMAYTDAMSVSCKSLGIGADVYWEKDSSKYDQRPQNPPQQSKPACNDNNSSKPEDTPKSDSAQPNDLEKRAAAIYFTMTGDKKGQLGWPVEEYKKWLKGFKEIGSISTDYGKKWTLDDLEFLEARVAELEPPF